MKSARLLAAALCLILVPAWLQPVSAQDNQRRSKRYVATRPITVDAQSGTLRLPTPQETQELVDSLVEMTNRSTDGLQVTTLANGTKSVDIDGRFQSVMLARPSEDGSWEMKCVATFEEATEFLGIVEDKTQQ
jgi:hypothetical protein